MNVPAHIILDANYNPAAEAFKNFDQDQSTSLMGSLHLDAEDEPRRGASRANSVRFDESAIHGQFGQNSRSANDYLPSRTGSAFGSHPLGERSLSHKSEGRQSSTHSGRGSSIGNESRPLSAAVTPFNPHTLSSGPPVGLFILGPVPSIIRCWLDTTFSNESLLYAAVCTGSYKSVIHEELLRALDFHHKITYNREGQRTIKLSVYLPEASIQQSSSRSASPAPQLPTMTTDFIVQNSPSTTDSIDIFLGCDVLRFRNADIHFSLDRLTILDDERNKVSVPLVRPENAGLFQDLQTGVTSTQRDPPSMSPKLQTIPDSAVGSKADQASDQTLPSLKRANAVSPETQSLSSPVLAPSAAGEEREENSIAGASRAAQSTLKANGEAEETDASINGKTPDTPSKSDNGGIWGSWRRESGASHRGDASFAGAASASGYQRAGRGRGMKILKPARLNTSRTTSSPQPTGFDAMPLRASEETKATSARKENQSPAAGNDRRSLSIEAKPPLTSKPSSANPVGGASAFGWLNSGQKE